MGYGYDAANRLVREGHSITDLRSWGYDWVGNRLDEGFVYDAQTDELTEGPAGVMRQYYTTCSMSQKSTTTYAYNPQALLRQVGASTTMD